MPKLWKMRNLGRNGLFPELRKRVPSFARPPKGILEVGKYVHTSLKVSGIGQINRLRRTLVNSWAKSQGIRGAARIGRPNAFRQLAAIVKRGRERKFYGNQYVRLGSAALLHPRIFARARGIMKKKSLFLGGAQRNH